MMRKSPPKELIQATELKGLSMTEQDRQCSVCVCSMDAEASTSVRPRCSTKKAINNKESPNRQAPPTQRSRCFLQPIMIEASVVGKTASNIHKWKSLSTKKVVWIKGTATIKTGTIKQWIAQTTAILIARWSSQPWECFFVSAIFSDIKGWKEPLYDILSTPVSTLTDD